ncbi:hypothetical protein [Caballeronia sp. INDeC2]|uniref:hypothetical protein n=1 Tax=Caballeronia sp. INDeC2 TaxID=2921747 RepID=UPI00202807EB|nr:hypothetical protein [Caballeronia sp. INDeC2]
MAQQKKAAPDWERIEGDYRAGLLSVREIAASQGISHTAIQKRAKAEGWVRDLSKRIQDKAEALVAKREVAKSVAMETSVSDLAIIDANAEVIAGIRLAHRKDIARSRNLAMALLAELESVTGNTELFEQLGEILRSPDEKGQDKRNDLYQKVISMSGRVSNMKALSDTVKTLVGLEREAYGINAAAEGGGNEAPVGLDHFYGDVEEGDA